MIPFCMALKKLKEIFNTPEKSSQIIWPSNRPIILCHTNEKVNIFQESGDIISICFICKIRYDCENMEFYSLIEGSRISGDIRWVSFQCWSILNVYWNIWDLSLNFLSIFWDGPKSRGSPRCISNGGKTYKNWGIQ